MDLKLKLIGNATWTIDVDNKFKIGCDPALAPKGTKYIYKGLKTSRVKDSAYDKLTFNDVELWMLTHGHFDHIDEKGLSVIEEGVKVISHKNCRRILKTRSDLDITYLKWNEIKKVQIKNYKIEVKAIPAVHGMNFIAQAIMGGVNGYLIKINDGKETKNIYVTSDSVFSEDIIYAIGNEKIDVLVANIGQAKEKMIGGPFTMNLDMLNRFRKALNPKLTLPIHIDDFEHFGTSRLDMKKLQSDKLKVLENGESIKL